MLLGTAQLRGGGNLRGQRGLTRGDLVALRVSGGYRKDDGWIDDVIRNEKDGNTVEKINARAQLLLKPAPDTSITFGILYQKENLGIPAFADTQLGKFRTGRVFRQSGESESQLYSLTVQQDFDTMALVSATNYLKKDSVNNIDATTAIRPLAISGPASTLPLSQ